MSSGDIKRLDGLVSDDALTELEATVNRMSVAQRNEIAVIKDDIYLSFPYQVFGTDFILCFLLIMCLAVCLFRWE